jgi:Ca-activated chloride channel homolog
MNLALVIDRSGSMSAFGRIENARRAAEMAVDRLGRDDILSVISYDDRVDVEVPATKVTDPLRIKDKIARLTPRGSTAIHAGMLAGANEVRKFKSRDRVNRVILLSDGMANVGPAKPADFVSLGRELGSEGITVSTIGLGNGYNEDLMAGLARSADGNHVFVQESADLANFLAREFDDALGIVGQQVEIIITLQDGVRPMRSLGRDAEIKDNRIIYKVGALIGGAEQVLLAELDVAAGEAREAGQIARIDVTYIDATTGARVTVAANAIARFDGDPAISDRSVNPAVVQDVATLISREARQEAVRLRDAGRAEEAKQKFEQNAATVKALQSRVPSAAAYKPLQDELKASEAAAAPQAQGADAWSKVRKDQRQFDSNSSGAVSRY